MKCLLAAVYLFCWHAAESFQINRWFSGEPSSSRHANPYRSVGRLRQGCFADKNSRKPTSLLARRASVPVLYDAGLSRVADGIAERILRLGNEDLRSNDNDKIRRILANAGYPVTSFGVEWGTTYEDYDSLLETLTQQKAGMLTDDAHTHFAVGFAPGRSARNGDLNAYVFLAVAYNTCVDCEPRGQKVHGERFLDALNAVRSREGLSPLVLDTDLLHNAARWHSNDMLHHGYPTERRGGIAHIGTDGSTASDRVEREGYGALVVRENILSRWSLDASSAFEQWWNSREHRENMMADDITAMALAVTCNPETGQYYYTQLLAQPFVEVDSFARTSSLMGYLDSARMRSQRRPLRPSRALMDYATDLAHHVVRNGQLPRDTAPQYSFETIYIAAVGTSFGAEGTFDYLMESHSQALLDSSFTEIGVGVCSDSNSKVHWHVVILAKPHLGASNVGVGSAHDKQSYAGMPPLFSSQRKRLS